jgi:peroxiredoxin/outer membrane lipoprotein-sorting protein
LASGQDGPAKARELLDAVATRMKDAPAIAFETEVHTGIETMESSHKVRVQLNRPNLARLEVSGAGQDALIVLDGTTSWHYVKVKNGFVKSPQLGTMKVEQYGAGPAAILFFEKGAGSLLPYLSDATVSKDRLGNDECSVVTWKVGTEETRVWTSENRLRRYATTRLLGGAKFETTFTYGPFDLSPAAADAAFGFSPPRGAVPLSGADETKLLAIGSDAPDLVATDLDGKPIKLADFKGKPVLLSFWFYSCSTCRQELFRLKKLTAEQAKRGLVMVAVDFGDTPETIRAYFEKEKFTFTPALQNKNDAGDAFGVRSYPTNYLIGPDGKIVWRASGFDEASLRTALDKLAPAN